MPETENKAVIELLLQTLKLNPQLWETRKKTAEILYDDKQYVEAADMLWNAPEIPSTDTDVAFAIKIISRAKPNRAIRMVYEVVRRNNGKPAKNMAVAKALNEIGMYMQAARFYGAALASDPSLFDLAFERQVLWLDDSNRLIEEWQKSDQEPKPPLNVASQDITGGALITGEMSEDTAQLAQTDNFHTPPIPQTPTAPLISNPAPAPAMASAVSPPPIPQKRILAPAPMMPSVAEVEVAPAPVRHTSATPVRPPAETPTSTPVPAVEVPTQPLQAAPAPKPKPASAAPISLAANPTPSATPPPTIGSTTGKLLTPSVSDKPPVKLK